MQPIRISLLFIVFASLVGCSGTRENQYIDTDLPGTKPRIFAPDLVSVKNQYEFGSIFSKDFTEFYYAVEINGKPEIRMLQFNDNKWSEPRKEFTSDIYGYNDQFLTPDNQQLFFISDRALDGKGDKKDIDIWYTNRTQAGWSEPINAGPAINSARNEYYISFTSNKTLYFASNGLAADSLVKNYDIYSSGFADGKFQEKVKLGDAINTEYYEADVFVAPDEKYLILCSERPGGQGRGDLYISFKDESGNWKPARNMGHDVNSSGYEFCPFVTPDGKYFLFTRDGDIYWVSSAILKELK